MHRRNLLSALLSLSGAIANLSCESPPAAAKAHAATAAAPAASSSATTPEPTKAPVALVVGHDAWVGYSGVFIAADLGYFKDAGLDVKLKPFSNPGDTLPALVAGQLDIGLTTLQNLVVLNGNSDTDVVAIAL